MSRRRKKHGIKWRSLYQWHRMLGLTAAAFVLLLATTGLMVNHTERLGLDSSYVTAEWLLDWYGIKVPDQGVSYAMGQHRISQLGGRLYFDERELVGTYGRLLGVIQNKQMLVVAVEGEVLLLTQQGELVEKLGYAQGVPAGMRQLGKGPNGAIVVLAAHGYYVTDEAMLDWHEKSAIAAHWARPQAIPSELLPALVKAYRGKGLSKERIVLDIHSGRILGTGGVLLMDAMALLFMLLATTGVWLWAKRKH